MLDERLGLGLGRDMDGAHPHGMRYTQVAWIILEHRGAVGGQPVERKDRLEGLALGLGDEARVFHAVDRVEQPLEPTMRDDATGIGLGPVGVDDAPAASVVPWSRQQRWRRASASGCSTPSVRITQAVILTLIWSNSAISGG